MFSLICCLSINRKSIDGKNFALCFKHVFWETKCYADESPPPQMSCIDVILAEAILPTLIKLLH